MNKGIDSETSSTDIAKEVIRQHQDSLMSKFPNILSISDAVHDMNQKETHVITIYLEDNLTAGIPDNLEVIMPNQTTHNIATELIVDVGGGKIQYGQFDGINTKGENFDGSFCCRAKTINNKHVLITAGHIYSQLASTNYGGWLNDHQKKEVLINKNILIGNWIFQQITGSRDIAFIELLSGFNDQNLLNFSDKGYHVVTDHSVKKEIITLISNKSGKRNGFLLDHNTTWKVGYGDGNQFKNSIIVIGSTIDRNTSKTLSTGGDSGGLAIHAESGALVGLILGGNAKYTWVLPIRETLEYFELTLT